MLRGDIGKDLADATFGLLFQAVVWSIVGGILISLSVFRGVVGMEWLVRAGLALQLMGLMLLVLEYAGFSRSGPSPLRWWVRSRSGAANPDARPAAWPGQAVVIVGVAAIALGLVLQLLGSFS
ncbi:MAG: hypothetical protein ACE5Q6_17920 [Dehalococcoidia bacterium]